VGCGAKGGLNTGKPGKFCYESRVKVIFLGGGNTNTSPMGSKKGVDWTGQQKKEKSRGIRSHSTENHWGGTRDKKKERCGNPKQGNTKNGEKEGIKEIRWV